MTYRRSRRSRLSRLLVWLAFKLGIVGPKNWLRTRRIVPKEEAENEDNHQ